MRPIKSINYGSVSANKSIKILKDINKDFNKLKEKKMIGKLFWGLLVSSFFAVKVSAQTIDLSGLNADVETGTDGTGLTIEILDSVTIM